MNVNSGLKRMPSPYPRLIHHPETTQDDVQQKIEVLESEIKELEASKKHFKEKYTELLAVVETYGDNKKDTKQLSNTVASQNRKLQALRSIIENQDEELKQLRNKLQTQTQEWEDKLKKLNLMVSFLSMRLEGEHKKNQRTHKNTLNLNEDDSTYEKNIGQESESIE